MSARRLVSTKRIYHVVKDEAEDIDRVTRDTGEVVSKPSDILSFDPGTVVTVTFKDGSETAYEVKKGDDIPDKGSSTAERAEDRRTFETMLIELRQQRKDDREFFNGVLGALQFEGNILKDIIGRQHTVLAFALDSLGKVMGHNNALVAAGVTPGETGGDWIDKASRLLDTASPVITLGLAAAEHRGLVAPGTAQKFAIGTNNQDEKPKEDLGQESSD